MGYSGLPGSNGKDGQPVGTLISNNEGPSHRAFHLAR